MNSHSLQDALVATAFEHFPPRLRRSLLSDKKFLARWNVPVISGVTLGKNGPSFQRDQLYDGIRAAIRQPGSNVCITDREKVTWKITARSENDEFSFVLESAGKQFSLIDHSALAEDPSIRIVWFEKTAREVNIEDSVCEFWRGRIAGEPLNDDEFDEIVSELALTPVRIYRTLQSSFEQGSADIATLIPNELRYYERLVGSFDSVMRVMDYVKGEAAPLIVRLQDWDPIQGFLFSLLMCSKSTISETIRIDQLDAEHLVRTYDWLATQGDPISQIGAVEVALSHIDTHPELEPLLTQMIEKFIADDPDNDGGCFSLLSAMIVLVASELTRRGTLESVPPFYRKQVAITQASLIVRAINGSEVEPTSVAKWAKTRGVGHIFFLQGLIDLRVEPRWLPDFVSAYQLRAEFIGRVSNAVHKFEGKIQSQSLRSLLVGKDSKLANSIQWPFQVLPGPLEGGMPAKQPIPDDILKDLTAALETDHLEPNSFAILVNIALLFDLPVSQAELVATALRRVKYSIEYGSDKSNIFGLISGLAIVAAVTRGTELAEELRVLVRVMKRKKQLDLDPDDEMRIAMIAAASHEGLEGWARFAGEWITEIAFQVVEKGATQRFLPKLRRLVQIEPALARHCAAADAALASYLW